MALWPAVAARALAPNLFLVPPCRLVDTRSSDAPPLAAGEKRVWQVSGRCGVPVAADGVLLNLAVVNATTVGWLGLYPGDLDYPASPDSARTSVLNYQPGETLANNTFARLATNGAGSLGVTSAGATNLVIDVLGYTAPGTTPAGAGALGPVGYQPLLGCRLADTVATASPLQAGESRRLGVRGNCDVPFDAPAALLNLVATQASGTGHLRAHASDAATPPTSALNFRPGWTIANTVESQLGGPQGADLTIENWYSPSTDVRLDALGYYAPGTATRVEPITACRVLDTRRTVPPSPMMAGDTRLIDVVSDCGPPVVAGVQRQAAFVNITVLGPNAAGFLRAALPGVDDAPPTMYFEAGEPALAHATVVPLEGGRRFALTAGMQPFTGLDVVVDVFAYVDGGGPPASSTGGPPLGTTEDENSAKGFRPEKVFQLNDVDHVNLFNGNLVVTLPLGLRYPVGPDLDFGLSLVYNSNPWLFDTVPVLDPNHPEAEGTEPRPDPQFNAGLGWQVTLGRLFPPASHTNDQAHWEYVAPDGSVHPFFDKLHSDDPEDAGDTLEHQRVQYTRDGSYIRWTELASGGSMLELPNGQRHTFDGAGRLQRIEDHFGNWIAVAYNPVDASTGVSVCSPSPSCWVITDSASTTRRQVVYFKSLPNYPQTIDRIALMGFRDAAQTPSNLIQFDYGTPEATTVDLPCPNSLGGPLQVQVPLLRRIVFADGSSYDMGGYATTNPGSTCRLAGVMQSLRVPTGGQIAWTYATWTFPAVAKPWGGNSNGVATRTVTDPWGSGTGTWTYTHTLLNDIPGFNHPTTAATTVTDPLGDKTTSYFSIYGRGGNVNGDTCVGAGNCWSTHEYGLPIRHSQTSGSAASGLFFLSREVTPHGQASPIRQSFVAYDQDTPQPASRYEEELTALNSRVSRERTVYEDDCVAGSCSQYRTSDTLHSGFDGLGHYRSTSTDGNFVGANQRVALVDYNPSRGTYPGSYQPLTANQSWLLDTYDLRSSSESGTSTCDRFTFDAATGFLTQRILTASGTCALGGGDVKVDYTPTTGANPGFVASERHSGADTGTSFTIDHTYTCGTRSRSTFAGSNFNSLDSTVDCPTGLVYESRDAAAIKTIYGYDRMGRLTLEQPNGEAFVSHTYTLPTTTANSQPRVTTKSYDPASPNVTLAQTEVRFDGFGRPNEHRRHRAGGDDRQQTTYDALGHVTRESTWFRGATATAYTAYSNFDPFGRAGRIEPPTCAAPTCNPAQPTKITYTGDSAKSVERWVARRRVGASIVEDRTKTTWQYDRFGRIATVTEPSEDSLQNPDTGASGACYQPAAGGGFVPYDATSPGPCNATTSYAYDVGGRLRDVNMATDFGTQTRHFEFDPRGFLQWETGPERGGDSLDPTHDVDYRLYDAFGHVGRKVEGSNDLRYTFNGAGQLVLVKDLGGTRPLLSFEYGIATGSKSKVVESRRYNYRALGGTLNQAIVYQQYTYSGVTGRATTRWTKLSVSPASDMPGLPDEQFLTQFHYDILGELSSIDYPQCYFATQECYDGPGHTTPADRTVTYGYSDGLLTTVSGFTTSNGITYSPNGMVATIARTNGVVDTLTPDPTGLPRIHQISVSAGGATFGPYDYDSSGNLVRFGTGAGQPTNSYTYDLVGRVRDVLTTDGTTQVFDYDAFGNLQHIKSNQPAFSRNTPTEAATNHLGGAVYDNAGNLTSWQGQSFEYDSLGMVASINTAGPPCSIATDGSTCWYHSYDADGQRVWSFQPGRQDRWTIRDLAGNVLRQFTATNFAGWQNAEDYVYRGNSVLASVTPTEGVRHFHLDHLGTPSLFTDAQGNRVGYQAYLPYGEQISPISVPLTPNDLERIRFTGHERDLGNPTSTADDVDYMGARYYRALVGRFLAVDSEGGTKSAPQTWNRYEYAGDNPVALVDPDGAWPRRPDWVTDGNAVVGGSATAMGIANKVMATSVVKAPAGVALGDLSIAGEGGAVEVLGGGAAGWLGVGGLAAGTFATSFYLTTKLDQLATSATGDDLALEKAILPGFAQAYEMWRNSGASRDELSQSVNQEIKLADKTASSYTAASIGLKSQIAHEPNALNRAAMQQKLNWLEEETKSLRAKAEKLRKAKAQLHL